MNKDWKLICILLFNLNIMYQTKSCELEGLLDYCFYMLQNKAKEH